jgi:hypothetical protein
MGRDREWKREDGHRSWKHISTGWWFGTLYIFPNSWDDDPIRLIFFTGGETTTQSKYKYK